MLYLHLNHCTVIHLALPWVLGLVWIVVHKKIMSIQYIYLHYLPYSPPWVSCYTEACVIFCLEFFSIYSYMQVEILDLK